MKEEELVIREVEISSAVLERLKQQAKSAAPLIPISSPASQALVLFRPLRPPSLSGKLSSKEAEDDEGEDEESAAVQTSAPTSAPVVIPDDDAMDVE